MTLSNLLVFALALMVAPGSPGPGVAALVARVLTNGFRDVALSRGHVARRSAVAALV